MKKNPDASGSKRKAWLRGLYMLFMLLALHVCEILLVIFAVIQFVITLMNGAPNERLVAFGDKLGIYLRQIAHFLTYASEEVPFPFSEWPEQEKAVKPKRPGSRSS
jgi:Domain of unknown function (DUF4389)